MKRALYELLLVVLAALACGLAVTFGVFCAAYLIGRAP